MTKTNIFVSVLVVSLQACSLVSNDALAGDVEEICDSYERLANSGNANAQLELANCYMFGFGRDRDLVEAERWLARAIENGSSVAKVSLASLILFKVSDETRYSEAVKLLEAPAAEGNAKAAFALSLAYRNGMGVPVDAQESARQLDRAASDDHIVARFVLFGQLVIGERKPDCEDSVDYWRSKIHESIASNEMMSIEDFKKRAIADDLIVGFIFSREDVERILEHI